MLPNHHLPAARFTGCGLDWASDPARKCWATFKRPLRGLNSIGELSPCPSQSSPPISRTVCCPIVADADEEEGVLDALNGLPRISDRVAVERNASECTGGDGYRQHCLQAVRPGANRDAEAQSFGGAIPGWKDEGRAVTPVKPLEHLPRGN